MYPLLFCVLLPQLLGLGCWEAQAATHTQLAFDLSWYDSQTEVWSPNDRYSGSNIHGIFNKYAADPVILTKSFLLPNTSLHFADIRYKICVHFTLFLACSVDPESDFIAINFTLNRATAFANVVHINYTSNKYLNFHDTNNPWVSECTWHNDNTTQNVWANYWWDGDFIETLSYSIEDLSGTNEYNVLTLKFFGGLDGKVEDEAWLLGNVSILVQRAPTRTPTNIPSLGPTDTPSYHHSASMPSMPSSCGHVPTVACGNEQEISPGSSETPVTPVTPHKKADVTTTHVNGWMVATIVLIFILISSFLRYQYHKRNIAIASEGDLAGDPTGDPTGDTVNVVTNTIAKSGISGMHGLPATAAAGNIDIIHHEPERFNRGKDEDDEDDENYEDYDDVAMPQLKPVISNTISATTILPQEQGEHSLSQLSIIDDVGREINGDEHRIVCAANGIEEEEKDLSVKKIRYDGDHDTYIDDSEEELYNHEVLDFSTDNDGLVHAMTRRPQHIAMKQIPGAIKKEKDDYDLEFQEGQTQF